MTNPDVPDGLYMVVSGRSGTTLHLDPFALVITERADTAGLTLEQSEIVRLCRQPIPPAELSARLEVPLGAVTILLADLADQGYVSLRAAGMPAHQAPADDRQLLEKLRVGLINLSV